MDAAARYREFRAIRFFGSLDGLRALSIMGVVWFHCWWGTPYLHPFCSRRARKHRRAIPAGNFPIGLAVTVGVAYVSYRYFETPFLALKTRFSRLNTAAVKPSIPVSATAMP
jgi:peptidoglycan/LPS O-acetylase OafA/YrhL